MNIQKFAKATELSPHTLRYYERIGLLRPIDRDASGYRTFSQADLRWIAFIKRLKETAMPLKDIQAYAQLREQGDGTAAKRMEMLQAHAAQLEQKIAAEQEHLQNLKEKIRWYESQIATNKKALP